jgi:hypothetical protein
MECRTPRREDESRVKWLLEEIYPGLQVCEHDDQSENELYDLDLCWPDGRVEAMEVTSADARTMPEMKDKWRATRAVSSAIIKRPEVGYVEAERVRNSWIVTLAVPHDSKGVRARLARIRSRLDRLLALREKEQTFKLFHDQMMDKSATIDALRELGVADAMALIADGDPVIFLMGPRIPLPDELEPMPADLLNNEIEVNARCNARKLGRSGKGERHLFVWVDAYHPSSPAFDSTTLLEDILGHQPDIPPRLPPEVTTAWAATEGHGATVVWRVRPPESWVEVFRGPRLESDPS